MKPCSIGFVITKTSWLSRCIAWFMSSKWSHAFLVLDDKGNTIETNEINVHMDDWKDHVSNPDKECEIYEPLDLSEYGSLHIIQRAEQLLGRRYGYVKILLHAIQLLLRRVGINFKFNFKYGILCDDVIFYSYITGPYPELWVLHTDSTDTEDLYQIVKNSPNFRKVELPPKGNI